MPVTSPEARVSETVRAFDPLFIDRQSPLFRHRRPATAAIAQTPAAKNQSFICMLLTSILELRKISHLYQPRIS